MPSAPNWTTEELDSVLDTYAQLWQTLEAQIPGRLPGGLSYVRSGIHAVHRGRPTTYLSQALQKHLLDRRGHLVCPECGERF